MGIREISGLVSQLQQIEEFQKKAEKAIYDFCSAPHSNTDFYVVLLNYLVSGKGSYTTLRLESDWKHSQYMKFFKLMFLKSPKQIVKNKKDKYYFSYTTPGFDDDIDMCPDSTEGIGAILGMKDEDLSLKYSMKIEERYENDKRHVVVDMINPAVFEDGITAAYLESKFEEWVYLNFSEEIEKVKEDVQKKKEKDKQAKAEKAAKDAEKELKEFLRLKQKFEGEKK